MKTTLALVFSAVLTASSMAGTTGYINDKRVVPTEPELACFGAGFDIGLFGGGFLPRHESGGYDDALGGGVLAEYFFSEWVGLQVSYGAFATDSVQHLVNGDLIVRYPIQSVCLAPYIMAGGGFHVDGSTLGEWHAGAGIECKFKSNPKFGLFADGAYYWHSSDNRDRDFTLVRVGVKFNL